MFTYQPTLRADNDIFQGSDTVYLSKSVKSKKQKESEEGKT